MTVTPEEIAAFADGELDPQRQAEVAAALAADPALADRVRVHRALRRRLAAHFAPILDAPLPGQLTSSLRTSAEVVDLTTARQRRAGPRLIRRWGWLAAPALAASVAVAVFLPGGNDAAYLGGDMAAALDRQLVAEQSREATTQVLLSFRDETGTYCRAFTAPTQSGIACREPDGWRLRVGAPGGRSQGGEYRMAGSNTAALLEEAQAMAAGPALDAGQEAAARARGWR